ncbi:MAG: response regulator transcription factor [Acidobacteriota bacterium]|nr:response regulator transcription factor [Acidobacteriota bacterium]
MTQDSIRLLLLDDHCLFRASLSRFLSSVQGFEVAAEYATGAQAFETLSSNSVNVVLLDLDPDAGRGGEILSGARAAGFTGSFLIVADTPDVRVAATALKLGASGVFLKSEPPDRLVRAIHQVAEGELWIEPTLIRRLAEQFLDRCPQWDYRPIAENLEEREQSVLAGILSGQTNRRIGDNMGLSESSVKNIVQRLFGKAGVKTRSQLVRVALEGSLTPNHAPAAHPANGNGLAQGTHAAG